MASASKALDYVCAQFFAWQSGTGSSTVRLDGSGVQLSSSGGTLVLRDCNGIPVDAATFTAAEASVENQYGRLSPSRVPAL